MYPGHIMMHWMLWDKIYTKRQRQLKYVQTGSACTAACACTAVQVEKPQLSQRPPSSPNHMFKCGVYTFSLTHHIYPTVMMSRLSCLQRCCVRAAWKQPPPHTYTLTHTHTPHHRQLSHYWVQSTQRTGLYCPASAGLWERMLKA